jgi:hypothetical protein
VVGVVPQSRKSARGYEEELRRRELAVGRALTQILPADRRVTVRELAEARRVLANALRDLRQLQRQVANDIKQLKGRTGTSNGGGLSRARAGGAGQPRELTALEAASDAIEEVLARWEGRRDQLAAEIQRRGARDRR